MVLFLPGNMDEIDWTTDMEETDMDDLVELIEAMADDPEVGGFGGALLVAQLFVEDIANDTGEVDVTGVGIH